MLYVLNLVKSFHHLEILNNFSLSVPRHGFTVLIGPSGCGKSTLFNVLAGAGFYFAGPVPHPDAGRNANAAAPSACRYYSPGNYIGYHYGPGVGLVVPGWIFGEAGCSMEVETASR